MKYKEAYNTDKEKFLNKLVEIMFRDNCKTKEAALRTIFELNLAWDDFIKLFPNNYLIYKEDYLNYIKQRKSFEIKEAAVGNA